MPGRRAGGSGPGGLADGGADCRDHVVLLVAGEGGGAGQVEGVAAEPLGDRAQPRRAAAVGAGQVQRCPRRPGLDAVGGEPGPEPGTRHASDLRVDGDGGQPAGCGGPRCLVLEPDARQSGQPAGVPGEDSPFGGDEVADAFELGAADSGVQVGHQVIPRGLAVPVFHGMVTGLADQVPGTAGGVAVVGEDDAAAAGGDQLVCVEAGGRQPAAPAGLSWQAAPSACAASSTTAIPWPPGAASIWRRGRRGGPSRSTGATAATFRPVQDRSAARLAGGSAG